ncbi:MAG: PDZ domain-containing protein, partial [Alistipes sp.]|nr:PDZ domain-containing protein [Alistipes sp.]
MKFLQRYAFPALIVISLFGMGWLFGNNHGRRLTNRQIGALLEAQHSGKLGSVVSYIEQEYIEPLTADSITELAIPAIISKLDPHSAYIPAKDFKEVEEPLEGEFDGIGVVFNMATDTVIVLNTIPSGPSQKAGVVAGDRIIRVNDTLIAGQKMSQREVMKRLRGPRGSKVNLSLERKGITEPVVVTVTRDAIPLNSVEATVMLTDRIGFIRLSQFARTSYDEVTKSIDTLRKQGMQSLILDLRDNSGGFLDQAILIANEFLERG